MTIRKSIVRLMWLSTLVTAGGCFPDDAGLDNVYSGIDPEEYCQTGTEAPTPDPSQSLRTSRGEYVDAQIFSESDNYYHSSYYSITLDAVAKGIEKVQYCGVAANGETECSVVDRSAWRHCGWQVDIDVRGAGYIYGPGVLTGWSSAWFEVVYASDPTACYVEDEFRWDGNEWHWSGPVTVEDGTWGCAKPELRWRCDHGNLINESCDRGETCLPGTGTCEPISCTGLPDGTIRCANTEAFLCKGGAATPAIELNCPWRHIDGYGEWECHGEVTSCGEGTFLCPEGFGVTDPVCGAVGPDPSGN